MTAASADHVGSVERRIREGLGPAADVIAPTTAATFASTTTRTVERIAGVVTALALALMVVVVFFVMLVTVRERAREIGTLKALGASDSGLVVQFLAEATGLSVVGGLLGMGLFGAFGWTLARRLFALSVGPFLPAAYTDTLFDALGGLGPALSGSTLGLVLVVALGVASLGSGYGLWQVTRLSPVEAMRHE